MEPNAGRDLQNALSDLENSVQQAQQHNMKGHFLHDVQNKTDDLGSRINDDQSQGLISQAVDSALSGELQNFSDAVGGNN